jgi:C-terminal processing protease CtpA/Prc
VRFKRGSEGEWFDDRHEVAWIDPKGPAAKTELAVGDIVVSVDGSDVTGQNTGNFDPLIHAAPGTTITLGLARGATVKIVLASP